MNPAPCVLCEFEIQHRHHADYSPVMPCRACYVGVHWACDPCTYFCSCSCGLTDREDSPLTATTDDHGELPLPEPTDPSQVPPDEGDAGQAEADES